MASVVTSRLGRALLGIAALALSGQAALAQQSVPEMPRGMGQPAPWMMDLQGAATPVMEHIREFHNFVLVIITVITAFVAALLGYIIFRFNSRRNPVPSRVTHNTPLEVAWTVLPILVLVVIAIPSFRLLFEEQVLPKADMTVKVTGNQWYWSYEYPDAGGLAFDSNLVAEADLKPGQPRLLAVDNEVVVPVDKVVRIQVTGSDVIHSFAMPSFGLKIDAIPGRLNEGWFKATREGIFYGQCSELCGTKHAYMPIAIRVVSNDAYTKWVSVKKAELAGPAHNAVAALQPAAR